MDKNLKHYTPVYYRDLSEVMKQDYMYSWQKDKTHHSRKCLSAIEKGIDIQVGIYFHFREEEIEN